MEEEAEEEESGPADARLTAKSCREFMTSA